jgi:hypothetical protein
MIYLLKLDYIGINTFIIKEEYRVMNSGYYTYMYKIS